MKIAKWFVATLVVLLAWSLLKASPPLKTKQLAPDATNSLSISFMRSQVYPGSHLIIEKTLLEKSSYKIYMASYLSEGLKIYGLLTVPKGERPAGGWPGIIFNHGYIDPKVYRTEERYIEYVDSLARSGYVVFKPDYRGNGKSEGAPDGPYYSPAYTIDDLNALASLKQYAEVNPDRIGMWGHSMGGNITLRGLVVDSTDIKAAVIWGGVVGSYDEIINHWQNVVTYKPDARDLQLRNNHLDTLVTQHGMPNDNPGFWDLIDPTRYLADIQAPIQLHTGGSDPNVPIPFSTNLRDKLEGVGKTVEYYSYPGGDHNIDPPQFALAMQRTIAFFDKYLK